MLSVVFSRSASDPNDPSSPAQSPPSTTPEEKPDHRLRDFPHQSTSFTVPEAHNQQHASLPKQPRQPQRREHRYDASLDWIDELVRLARPRIDKPNTQRKSSETFASEPQNADEEPGQPEQSTAQQTLTTMKDSSESGKKRGLARQAKGVNNKPLKNTKAPQKSSNKGISKASHNINTKCGKNTARTSLRPGLRQLQSHHP
jgi:hypothetical protein